MSSLRPRRFLAGGDPVGGRRWPAILRGKMLASPLPPSRGVGNAGESARRWCGSLRRELSGQGEIRALALERHLGAESHADAAIGVAQFQAFGVEHQARKIAGRACGVEGITQDWVAYFEHMDAKLVRAPGFRV